MSHDEQRLDGGNVATVVRLGDTVRRAPSPWTATTQRLLAHVRSEGFVQCPEPMGLDERGRAVWSFVPGTVPHGPREAPLDATVLRDAARMLRQWHDAGAGFDREGAVWGLAARDPDEVICHNDFAPYNCVFRDGKLAAVIDFDTCAPGPRLWDIAYAAYRFVPLLPDEGASPLDRRAVGSRLSLFLSAYAGADGQWDYSPRACLSLAAERLAALAAWTERHASAVGRTDLRDHAAMYHAHSRRVVDILD